MLFLAKLLPNIQVSNLIFNRWALRICGKRIENALFISFGEIYFKIIKENFKIKNNFYNLKKDCEFLNFYKWGRKANWDWKIIENIPLVAEIIEKT